MRTHFYRLPAHRSPGTAAEEILYPSMVQDPLKHSEIHAIAIMTLRPREVL